MLATLKDVLLPAQREQYAVGLFNVVSLAMAQGVMRAAETLRAPVIIGTSEAFLPFCPLDAVADMLLPWARRTSVPVALHFDHGSTFEGCMRALRLGFSSVMYDCSTLPYEENVLRVAEMARIAHAMGVTVEGELGHVAGEEGGASADGAASRLTDPAWAQDYVERTGIDALAVAVGNAHGAYRAAPKLDFPRIASIAGSVSVPLVLHGGSGLTDADFQAAIHKGIAKVNIFTDIDQAADRGHKDATDAGITSAMRKLPYQMEAVKAVAMEKMKLFGCAGRA